MCYIFSLVDMTLHGNRHDVLQVRVYVRSERFARLEQLHQLRHDRAPGMCRCQEVDAHLLLQQHLYDGYVRGHGYQVIREKLH
jgi:hypothetical protein